MGLRRAAGDSVAFSRTARPLSRRDTKLTVGGRKKLRVSVPVPLAEYAFALWGLSAVSLPWESTRAAWRHLQQAFRVLRTGPSGDGWGGGPGCHLLRYACENTDRAAASSAARGAGGG